MLHPKLIIRCRVTFGFVSFSIRHLTIFSDRSENEKNLVRLAYAHVLVALDQLACKYAALLLGINLKNFHHMRNGE